jgi:hypothetical protein
VYEFFSMPKMTNKRNSSVGRDFDLHHHVIVPNEYEIGLFDYLWLVMILLLLEDDRIFRRFYHNYFSNEF